jgi:hypothetical protein
MERYFRYTGEETLTRGNYGVVVKGGHTNVDYPNCICVFDPDMGDMYWADIEYGIECGDWVEITRGEWETL